MNALLLRSFFIQLLIAVATVSSVYGPSAHAEDSGAEGVTAHYKIPQPDGTEETLTVDGVWMPVRSNEELGSILEITSTAYPATAQEPWIFYTDSDGDRQAHKKGLLGRAWDWVRGKKRHAEVSEISSKDQNKLKTFIKEVYKKPTPTEMRLGLVQATYMGITSASMFFSAAGIDPISAFAATALRTALSIFHGPWGGTTDRFLTRSFKDPTKRLGKTAEMIRRQVYNWFTTTAIRLLSGPVNGLGAAFTMQGQMEILTYLVTVGFGGVFLHSSRLAAYKDDVDTNARMSFASFLLTAPVQMADLAGLGKRIVVDLGFYEVKESTATIVGVYVGLVVALRVAPNLIKKLLYAFDGPVAKIRRLFKKRRIELPAACGDNLNKESESDIPDSMLKS